MIRIGEKLSNPVEMFSDTVMAMLVNGLGSLRFSVVPGSGGDAGIIVDPCSSLQLASKC